MNIKLKDLNKIIKHKRELASVYFENLNNNFILPKIERNKRDVYYIFNVRHELRDKLRKYLLKKNISTDIHYPIPPYRQMHLRNILKTNFLLLMKFIVQL